MPGPPTITDDSSRGGVGVVLFVFVAIGFLLTIAAQAGLQSLTGPKASMASKPGDPFDVTPVANLVQPAPKFAPDDVVKLQLAGLANPDVSAGIQQCFAFASPGNREMTGPLSRFAMMVRRPPYAVLMHHRIALVGEPTIKGESAAVVVTVLDDLDQVHVFQFLLSKQHGDKVENCWMTDAVYPLEQVPGESPVRSATASRDSVPAGSAHG
jgi:hypothetical protein